MTERPGNATTKSFDEKYRKLQSDAAERLRHGALGSAVPHGYTTLSQARRLADHLALSEGQLLLDLGGGRGWPGSEIAARTGCDLVTTDLPLRALLAGRDRMLNEGRRSLSVCADGRRLPFRDAVFDGVCHTDVLC